MFNWLKGFLINLLNTRFFWVCVLASALAFEVCGWYFQYVDHLQPCELCVYERAAFAAILLISAVVLIKPVFLKYLGIPAWLYASWMGLSIAMEHVDAEGNIFAQCNNVIAAQRFWLPLDKWIPGFFNPTGNCGDIPWSLGGLSMPWWVRAIFIGYLTAILISVLIHICCWKIRKKRCN